MGYCEPDWEFINLSTDDMVNLVISLEYFSYPSDKNLEKAIVKSVLLWVHGDCPCVASERIDIKCLFSLFRRVKVWDKLDDLLKEYNAKSVDEILDKSMDVLDVLWKGNEQDTLPNGVEAISILTEK